MKILAIETSCDETAAAVTEGRRVLSSSIYSQILIHKKWGGVVPSLAKRAHLERIDGVIDAALKGARLTWDDIDVSAVTVGPGLAIALEVGIDKAKELAKKYNKKLVAINHMEGHIMANYAQNSQGNPKRDMIFPALALLISGGHTELVLCHDNLEYEVLGETVDDAVGEALDKAGKMLGLGYPGGPAIERLAREAGNIDTYQFTRPMMRDPGFSFSYSGLKTALYYKLKELSEKEKKNNLRELASSFQEAAFHVLIVKTERAIRATGVKQLLVGGGVSANSYLRTKLRALGKKHGVEVLFPPQKYLCTDNAAMIGIAAHFRAQKGEYVDDLNKLERIPRLHLAQSVNALK